MCVTFAQTTFTGRLLPPAFSNRADHVSQQPGDDSQAAAASLGVPLVPWAGPVQLLPTPIILSLFILPHSSELTQTLRLLFCRFIAVLLSSSTMLSTFVLLTPSK